MKIAVVTGASSGFGREFVKQIDKKYRSIDEIWVIARRETLLHELAKEINNKRVRVLPLDLTNDNQLRSYADLLDELQPSIRLLVNNAGFGQIGNFEEIPLEKQTSMVDLNCKGLMYMTYVSLPYMSKKANIIQLASSAAFMPQPRFSIYAATKSFVLSFSRALNRELNDKNITVTAVCPGPSETEFFDNATSTGNMKIFKRFYMSPPEKIVEKALKDANDKKEISVYGSAMNSLRIAAKMIPHRAILPFIR